MPTFRSISLLLLGALIILALFMRDENHDEPLKGISKAAHYDVSNLPYYSPTVRSTVNWNEVDFDPADVRYFGRKTSMIVASDMSRSLIGIMDGRVEWTRTFPETWPRALDIYKGLAYVGNRYSILILQPFTGETVAELNIPNLPERSAINSVRLSALGTRTILTLGLDLLDIESLPPRPSILVFDIVESEPGEKTLSLVVSFYEFSSPRDAVVIDGKLYVADTFGHKVIKIDLNSETHTRQTIGNFYFPNTIDFMTIGKGLQAIISAEHENRIVQLDLRTGKITIPLSCPLDLFRNPESSKDDIVANEILMTTSNEVKPASMSLCATRYSGLNTLYSPNSARLLNEKLVISDTDNHMVKVFHKNRLQTIVTGIPNPVNSVLF
ncbi:hypothetical protein [Azoarcus taiwanensis]|uniref:Uncharacterized protein n=1 Tax=Azoarcus taiwanensis TaxID=666964 RepID=A0A972F9Q0_9RHOO|nr:hypothetical protein [Azoarcus taiwanensis]NMG04782.1 hypothetical protein [Azoarcus taiwanensis]